MISGIFVGCANGFGSLSSSLSDSKNSACPFDLDQFESVGGTSGGSVYVEGRLIPVWNSKEDNDIFKRPSRIGWIYCDGASTCVSEYVILGTASDVVFYPMLDDKTMKTHHSRRFVLGQWHLVGEAEGIIFAECALPKNRLQTCLGEVLVIDKNNGTAHFFRDKDLKEMAWIIEVGGPITDKVRSM